MTGELILAIAVGLAVVVCGALAWWGAVKSFSRPGSGPHGKE